MNKPNCPSCGSDKFVVSIFGNACPECLYESGDEIENNIEEKENE